MFEACKLLLVLLLGTLLPALAANAAAGRNGVKSKIALVVVDVQGCFLPGGALPTNPTNGTPSLINNINTLRTAGAFGTVVFTQDWHPKGHISFASTHNKEPLDEIELKYTADGRVCDMQGVYPGAGYARCRRGNSSVTMPALKAVEINKLPKVEHTLQQVLWPEHCVQNTKEAQLHSGLIVRPTDLLLRKGSMLHIDSYSAFEDNGGVQSTGLANALRKRGIGSVVVVGIALDYCVLYTALDAKQAGFDTTVVLDATSPVSKATAADAVDELKQAGVRVVQRVWDAVHAFTISPRRRLISV